LHSSAVCLPVGQAVADAINVGTLRVCFDMVPVHCTACSLPHGEQVCDQLQQRACSHAQPTPSVAFVQVSADARQGTLAVRMHMQGVRSGEHGQCARNGLQFSCVHTTGAGDCRTELSRISDFRTAEQMLDNR
jgi:hypothetical protein